MSIDAAFKGSLFANDFLRVTVAETPDWPAIDDAALDDLEAELRAIFERFPIDGSPNESQTVNGGVKMYRRGGAKVSHGLGCSLSR